MPKKLGEIIYQQNLNLSLASLLIILLAIGCRPAPIGAFGALVENTTVAEVSREACLGGLRAKVTLSNVVIYDEVIPAEEEDLRRSGTADGPIDGLVRQGAPVVVQAWCFAEDRSELGYAEKQGLLNLYRTVDSVLVSPNQPNSDFCTPAVQRGLFPCIRDALD